MKIALLADLHLPDSERTVKEENEDIVPMTLPGKSVVAMQLELNY